jgi:flagellar biogenesis protein FliO
MVAILGAAGVLCIAAKRQAQAANGGRLRVVGRVALPPKHAVFLVKAGSRTLLIGAGPQGAPSLLGELDDDDETLAPAPASVVARTDPATRSARSVHAAQRFDARLGDES